MENLELVVKKAVKDTLDTYFGDEKKKFNAFTLPQIVWIIELYYLMCNSLITLTSLFPNDFKFEKFPIEVTKYNVMIFSYIKKWMPFINYMSIALLVSGIIISPIVVVPYLETKKVVRTYSSYGVITFGWFFLIYATFKLYTFNRTIFPLTFIIIIFTIIAWKKLLEFLNSKLARW